MKYIECEDHENPFLNPVIAGDICDEQNCILVATHCEICEKPSAFKLFCEKGDGRCLCKECREKESKKED